MSTHSLSFSGDVVVKRFRSYDRGEHAREWRGLGLLAQYAPGLAPTPLSADLDASPPWVSMSRLPGGPLGDVRLPGVGAALERLHTAVPADEVARLPPSMAHPGVRLAGLAPESSAARGWLASAEAAELASADVPAVLGREDHNVPNFLDDGSVVRLVDFEDCGRSDRAVELASLVEHVSWHGVPDVGELAAGLTPAELARFRVARRYYAILWLSLLRDRPPAARAQLDRVHDLLGS